MPTRSSRAPGGTRRDRPSARSDIERLPAHSPASAASKLGHAIRAAAAGKRVIPPVIATRLAEFTPRDDLSAREREVLLHVARGFSNKETARALGRSVETVKAHLESVFQKLGARDRTHAVTLALQRGIIRLDE